MVAVQVLDPDALSASKFGDAGREAGLVSGVVRRRRVGTDGVDARPALDERVAIQLHHETVASGRVVVQNLAPTQRASHTEAFRSLVHIHAATSKWNAFGFV